MAQRKGKTGNPKGRPRGAVNKVSRPIKDMVASALSNALAEWDEIWAALEPPQKLQAIRTLLEYVVPKAQPEQARTSIDVDELYAKWVHARNNA